MTSFEPVNEGTEITYAQIRGVFRLLGIDPDNTVGLSLGNWTKEERRAYAGEKLGTRLSGWRLRITHSPIIPSPPEPWDVDSLVYPYTLIPVHLSPPCNVCDQEGCFYWHHERNGVVPI